MATTTDRGAGGTSAPSGRAISGISEIFNRWSPENMAAAKTLYTPQPPPQQPQPDSTDILFQAFGLTPPGPEKPPPPEPPTVPERLSPWAAKPGAMIGRPGFPVHEKAGFPINAKPGYPVNDVTTYDESKNEIDRRRRQNALFDTTPNQKTSVDQMSWREYNALSPQERAAVDFNTLLVRAVHRDQRLDAANKYDPTQVEQKTYDKTLESVFGDTGRGSQTYAPETLSLLKQIGFHDTAADLNDFLKLKVAVTGEELQLIPESSLPIPGPHKPNTLGPYGEQLQLKRDLVEEAGAKIDALMKGNQVVGGFAATVAADRYDTSKYMGGLEQIPQGLGYATPKFVPGSDKPADLNTYFITGVDALANQANVNDTATILKQIKTFLKPDEYEQFMAYAAARAYQASTYNRPLGTAQGASFVTPDQFRAMLGIPGPQEKLPPQPQQQPQPQQEVNPGGQQQY